MDGTQPIRIRRAELFDIHAASKVLTASLDEDPVVRWLVPDDRDRQRILPDLFASALEHAICYGQVDVTDDMSAVAVWHRVTDPDAVRAAAPNAALAKIAGRWAGRFEVMDRRQAPYRLRVSHHHLAFLGVLPDRRRQGLGGALLRVYHRTVDEQQLQATLFASSRGNERWYLQHGYRSQVPLNLPGGPPMWHMRRSDQQPPAESTPPPPPGAPRERRAPSTPGDPGSSPLSSCPSR
jgi:GNAT superfamily N-acetyltransferase